MWYAQVPPADAANETSPRATALILPLARWALVVGFTFFAYGAVVMHETTSRYQHTGAHRSTLFTSPPNARSMLPGTAASAEGGGRV